jgi:hypothetical protein
MLPASTIAEITTNLASLNLQSNIAAQILAAVFAPLLRSSENRIDPEPNLAPRRRAGRPRARASARNTAAAVYALGIATGYGSFGYSVSDCVPGGNLKAHWFQVPIEKL